MKKATKNITAGILLTLSVGVVYTGCKKPEIDDIVPDTDVSSSQDNNSAENTFQHVFRSMNDNADSVNSRSSCGTITIVPDTTTATGFPKTITIDYGTTGVCGLRKGVIKGVFTGPFRDSGSQVTITYHDYYYGIHKVDATSHVLKNTGANTAGNFVYTVDIVGATLVSTAGTIAWSSTKSIEWLEGRSTNTSADDVFLFSGSNSGTSTAGTTFSATIDTPLRIATSCDYIESGAFTLTPEGKEPRTIDFGNTGCDSDVTVTIDGRSYDVQL